MVKVTPKAGHNSGQPRPHLSKEPQDKDRRCGAKEMARGHSNWRSVGMNVQRAYQYQSPQLALVGSGIHKQKRMKWFEISPPLYKLLTKPKTSSRTLKAYCGQDQESIIHSPKMGHNFLIGSKARAVHFAGICTHSAWRVGR